MRASVVTVACAQLLEALVEALPHLGQVAHAPVVLEAAQAASVQVGQAVLGSIARFCSNLPDAVIDMQVLGPPDIEQRVGLTGGHIFQREILPNYMWDRRLAARTPMPGIYLCGTVVGGTQHRYEIFIENGHVHVDRIVAHVTGQRKRVDDIVYAQPES